MKILDEHGDGSSVHYSLIYLEYIEISCIFASEIKPYLYAKECENEKQDGHLPNEHRNEVNPESWTQLNGSI